MVASGTSDEIIADSGISTWQGRGPGLQQLQHDLQIASDDRVQASVFGNSIHVSSKDEEKIKELIKPYREKLVWKKISPSLEDVFIDIVGREDTR
jgi:ABC-2 type transport system ATP-binding protein